MSAVAVIYKPCPALLASVCLQYQNNFRNRIPYDTFFNAQDPERLKTLEQMLMTRVLQIIKTLFESGPSGIHIPLEECISTKW